jgi:glycosyltransferase involved in cell wall biosynthesis
MFRVEQTGAGEPSEGGRMVLDSVSYSIIIPTFNRVSVLPRAIRSAVGFMVDAPSSEIIVVDDGSEDNTQDVVTASFSDLIVDGLLVYLRRSRNEGPTAAKNRGAAHARGDWLIFLDSDDELLPEAGRVINEAIRHYSQAPVIFFRCVDVRGRLIGPEAPTGVYSYADFLARGTPGECLPVVRRVPFLQSPYSDYLRGFESLCYLRLARRFGHVVVWGDAARRYHTDAGNRLSTRLGLYRRACQLAMGFRQLLKEFGDDIGYKRRLAVRFRCAYYGGLCGARRFLRFVNVMWGRLKVGAT